MAKTKKHTERELMEISIGVMIKSVQEPRSDKTSPKVGAVLVHSDGTIETAFRGELRQGDHAEFTLLERKNRSNPLDGSILFATLEPCAPGARRHPKLGCAERIVNARIKKVWVGIEDPDPTVDRKGIKFLLDHGVEVEMFDADLQEKIRETNKRFIAEAQERAKQSEEENAFIILSEKDQGETRAEISDLSPVHLDSFLTKAKLNVEVGTGGFNRIFSQLGLIGEKNGNYIPTGIGLLLFGSRPQLVYPHALIRATHRTTGRGEDIETIDGPLIEQADKIQSWYETRIGKQIDRSKSERQIIYDYPLIVFREAIINAIVHRDYDIEGAPIYFEINDNAIIIKSPGAPVRPLRIEQIKQFSAPSLSRNPKIMYVFDQMELVEQRGLGFQTIKELPTKYKLPLPLVTFEDPYLVFTFPRSGEGLRHISGGTPVSSLNNEELRGYDFVKLKGSLTRKEYEEHFGFERKKAERHLKTFVELGLVERKGAGPSTHYETITT
ncbi:MAG: hypothetical protein IPL46_15190 [Saprospiraceae bacterium]|nr:hypothetical protein [Saprospiraceae bacterium]